MSKWVEFQTQDDAVRFCEKMDRIHGYPDMEHGTERYTYIQKHPSKKLFVCAVEDGHIFVLDTEDKARLKDKDAVVAFFPEEKAT